QSASCLYASQRWQQCLLCTHKESSLSRRRHEEARGRLNCRKFTLATVASLGEKGFFVIVGRRRNLQRASHRFASPPLTAPPGRGLGHQSLRPEGDRHGKRILFSTLRLVS
ncbi:unnamed protein product, partial [Musa hybrid cultivar]